MDDWKSVHLDDPSMWPEEKLVDLGPAYEDPRGAIQGLVNIPMKNLSLIHSVEGSLRSNHYHLTDWHFMYVLRGRMHYYYREVGRESRPERLTVEEGMMVFTPPMEEHATVFLEDTDLIVVSRNPRDQETYESDVRRVALIDPGDYTVR